jgi:NAD+ diphosphatase
MWMLMTGDPARPDAQYSRCVNLGPLPDYPFRRTAHDRLSERRSDTEFLERSWRDPDTRVLVVRDGRLASNDAGDELRVVAPADAPPGERLLLGRVDGAVHFLVLPEPDLHAVDPAGTAGPPPQPDEPSTVHVRDGRFTSLRRLAASLTDDYPSLAVHAVALAGWHERHPRCAQCGAVTEVAEGGAVRRCPACATAHFPRTDPAVIMLVTDAADRCLLGHNSGRPAGWFSTLAGFVEPGETPEDAVAREVREEVGVQVCDVTYVGSQPWPFPSSLMLGYFAVATTTAMTVDGAEISDARWFSRDDLRAAVERGEVGIPTTLSIAGALLTAWYGAPLPDNVLTL